MKLNGSGRGSGSGRVCRLGLGLAAAEVAAAENLVTGITIEGGDMTVNAVVTMKWYLQQTLVRRSILQ